MSTIENNKLLAESIGLETGKQLGYDRWLNDWFDNRGVLNGQRNEKLLFDSDWNWLMKVIEKIDNLRTISSDKESYFYCVSLDGDCAKILDGKTGEVIVEIISGGSWIETTYKLVVEFVKWYNKNKLL